MDVLDHSNKQKPAINLSNTDCLDVSGLMKFMRKVVRNDILLKNQSVQLLAFLTTNLFFPYAQGFQFISDYGCKQFYAYNFEYCDFVALCIITQVFYISLNTLLALRASDVLVRKGFRIITFLEIIKTKGFYCPFYLKYFNSHFAHTILQRKYSLNILLCIGCSKPYHTSKT